jgi:tRNA/tmRNA/rRNA uracil-C5-methylase (TrmA/RlmC/RlmD family)
VFAYYEFNVEQLKYEKQAENKRLNLKNGFKNLKKSQLSKTEKEVAARVQHMRNNIEINRDLFHNYIKQLDKQINDVLFLLAELYRHWYIYDQKGNTHEFYSNITKTKAEIDSAIYFA